MAYYTPPDLPDALFKTPMQVGAPYNEPEFMARHYDMLAVAFMASGDSAAAKKFREHAEWARTEWAEKRADV